MKYIKFDIYCCKECDSAVDILDDICDSCGKNPCGEGPVPNQREATIKKLGEDNWEKGVFIAWAECERVKFGMTLTAPRFGRFKNTIGMCNHQGIPVSSRHFGIMGLSMFTSGFELLPEKGLVN